MAEKKIKCPKCGSTNTRDSQVKEMLEVGGKITGKVLSLGAIPLTGFLGEAAQRGVSKLCADIGGGVAGALWHKRVCDKCGNCWYYDF